MIQDMAVPEASAQRGCCCYVGGQECSGPCQPIRELGPLRTAHDWLDPASGASSCTSTLPHQPAAPATDDPTTQPTYHQPTN